MGEKKGRAEGEEGKGESGRGGYRGALSAGGGRQRERDRPRKIEKGDILKVQEWIIRPERERGRNAETQTDRQISRQLSGLLECGTEESWKRGLLIHTVYHHGPLLLKMRNSCREITNTSCTVTLILVRISATRQS